MKSYDLFIDEKYTLWTRTHVTIEADSLEEAVEKCKNGDYDDSWSEDLYDTAEAMTPEENRGEATVEIYSEDKDKFDALYTNKNDR